MHLSRGTQRRRLLLTAGHLVNLQGLSLFSNRLSGERPPELGSLPDLQVLNIWGDQLSGTLPKSLTGLTEVKWLWFFNKPRLCAPIDSAFQTWLNYIDEAYGSSCALEDSQEDRAVLAELHRATNGEDWGSSNNWLSNGTPREWSGVAADAEGRVTLLFLRRNQLGGEIPPELDGLSNLDRIYPSGNQLSACIPEGLREIDSRDLPGLGLPFVRAAGHSSGDCGYDEVVCRVTGKCNTEG